ncbi:MAG: PBP1A family penicillin-binding protein [Minisyncoccia bacterium]
MRRPPYHPLKNPHPFLTVAFIAVGIGFIIGGGIFVSIALTPAPDLTSFEDRKVTQSTKIYDRTGKTLLYDLDTDAKRQTVPLSEIAPAIQQATIAMEDASFYEHGGISFSGIARSLLTDIFHASFSQGGSTITQQVVKNTLLTGKKTIIRKIQEIALAIKLESRYSKDQILEWYLNEMPYGGPYYGVEVASEAFFGKSAKEVTLAEAAYLAAVLQAPTYYSPYGNNREALETRKNIVLARMQELGYITETQREEAKNEKVLFNPQRSTSIIAPHFVFYIEQYLENKYGADVVNSGLKVITTLDTTLQHEAEATVAEYALQNQKKFNASNAALIGLDPKTGQILAMVGSRNYFDPAIDGNFNATLALRQPGSSFKPFVYAAALTKGFTRDTAIFDLPTQFSTSCAASDNYNSTYPCYAPGNYDDKFRGPMTFTTALAQSINIPAVKTLYLAGTQNVVNLATAAGITTLKNPGQYGLALALGAAEVKLLDLASAFGTFANGGVHNPATGILSVTDASGSVLEEYAPNPTQVVNEGVANDISAMLSNNEARFPEYPPVNPLTFPGYDVAVKTGTTNDYRDAWTVGYTPAIVIGVWSGNNDNSPMVKEIAGYIVAPMWHAVMQKALSEFPEEYFGSPRAMSEDTKPVFLGNYRTNGEIHNILYSVNKDDPTGPAPSNPYNDPQFSYWEYPVQLWANQNAAVSRNSTTTPN